MFTPRNIGEDEPILTIFQIGLKPPSSFFLISIIALILSLILSLSLSVFIFLRRCVCESKNIFEACTFWYTSCTVVCVHLVFVGFHGCVLFTSDVLDCNWDGLHTFLVNWQESHSRSVEGGVKNSSRLAKRNVPNCSQQWSGKDGHQDIVYHRESCHPVMLSEYQKDHHTYLDPPFGYQISGQKGLCLVFFLGQKIQTYSDPWRIQEKKSL